MLSEKGCELRLHNVHSNFTDRDVLLQGEVDSLKNQLDSFRGISFSNGECLLTKVQIISQYVIQLKKDCFRSTKTDCLSLSQSD